VFRFLYNLAAAPLLPAGLRLLALFQDKARRLQEAQVQLLPELLAKLKSLPPDQARILVHVSSVGEYLSALPLIRAIRERYPRLAVVLSFSSPSLEGQLTFGARVTPPAQPLTTAFHLATYLPLDTSSAVRRFLDLVNPSLILFASYDVWPNLLWLARERGISCALVNGILSQASGRFRFPARWFFSSLYRNLDWVGAVAEEDVKRFLALGLESEKVAVTGNCRFDQTLFRCQAVTDQDPDLAQIPPQCWVIAGSTWPADEAVLLLAWARLAASHPDLGLILAPHEPSEKHLQKIEIRLEKARLSCIRYSYLGAEKSMRFRIVLVDKVGILYKLYRRGMFAFIGGGFGRGVHNVMEPAGMGLPVIVGPRRWNSAEALLMETRGGAFSVSNRAKLYAVMERLVEDEVFRREAGARAEAVVRENAGATERTLEKLMDRFPKIFSGGKD